MIDIMQLEVIGPAIRHGIKLGIPQGIRSVLRRQLTLRFGPLPDHVVALLDEATEDELLGCVERVLTADTLYEVLAPAISQTFERRVPKQRRGDQYPQQQFHGARDTQCHFRPGHDELFGRRPGLWRRAPGGRRLTHRARLPCRGQARGRRLCGSARSEWPQKRRRSAAGLRNAARKNAATRWRSPCGRPA